MWFLSRQVAGFFGMGLKTLRHLYIDNYWLELAGAAGCLTYLPDVVIEHMHPAYGKAEWDESYRRVNSPEMYGADGDRIRAMEEPADAAGRGAAARVAVRADMIDPRPAPTIIEVRRESGIIDDPPYSHITLVIVAHNEEARLPALLERVRHHFTRVVIAVQRSSDSTEKIARKWADEVVLDEHHGFGDASMPKLMHKVRSRWAFRLDADEMPSPASSGRCRTPRGGPSARARRASGSRTTAPSRGWSTSRSTATFASGRRSSRGRRCSTAGRTPSARSCGDRPHRPHEDARRIRRRVPLVPARRPRQPELDRAQSVPAPERLCGRPRSAIRMVTRDPATLVARGRRRGVQRGGSKCDGSAIGPAAEAIDYHLKRNDTPNFTDGQPGRVDLAHFLIEKILVKDLRAGRSRLSSSAAARATSRARSPGRRSASPSWMRRSRRAGSTTRSGVRSTRAVSRSSGSTSCPRPWAR
jgi:hypothetical protein